MGRFLAVLSVFLIAHSLPAMPAVRRALRSGLGEAGFIAAYSALSLVLFAWLIREAQVAPYVPLWQAGPWSQGVALVLVPLALLLLGAGALTPNPLSIAFVGGTYDPRAPGAVAITRHPLLWGLGLWGLAHVPANGHVVGLTLFGGLGLFAFVGMALVERRRRAALGPARWRALSDPTSVVPFGALLSGCAAWPRDRRTWAGGVSGLLLALLLLGGGHQWLFGRNPLAFLG